MDVDVAETEEFTAEIQNDGGDDIEDSNDDEEHQLDAQMDDLESSIDEMEKPNTVPDEESATKVEEFPDNEHDEQGTGAEEGGTDILHTKDLSQEGKATAEDDDSEMTNLPDEFETPEHDVTSGTGVEQSKHQDDAVNQSTESQGASPQTADQLRSLGDHLEQFRRMLHIEDASTQVDTDQEQQSRIAESQGDVEHVGPDINTSDQAMGPSTEEPEGFSADHDRPLPDLEEDLTDEALLPAEEVDDRLAQDEHTGQALAAENSSERAETSKVLQERNGREQSLGASNDVQSTDADMLETDAKQAAGAIWQQHERATRELANGLCEQLRLILEPTLATRLQGDFRTGKRLNMRRIIPYIASQFKKDKIWLRRNRPSKRQYQVILAIDDSKSMAESGSVPLAFDTLALVSTALSVLEVGSISVVKFAAQPEIVHDFKDSFSSDAGANIFGSFTFDENQTNVKALAAQSLEVFRNARSLQSGDAEDLWQLQFIISDGICDDHESIRRLLRQAHEERIMVVFVVLDTIHGNKKNSIMQMNQVKSVITPNGTKTLKIQSYMEDFASAFENFLIIQHVSDLPELLCSTIRQFFVGVSSS
jgi:midasin